MVINVVNLDKLLKKIENLQGIDLTPPVRVATRMVQKAAKEEVAVDTGTLRNSIYAKTIRRPGGKNGSPFAYGIVGTPVEYAIYQEFGTRFMEAQPFLRPAVKRLQSTIFKVMAIYVQEQLKTQAKK